MTAESINDNGVVLGATIDFTGDKIQIRYQVNNQSSSDLYVLDAMYRLDDDLVLDRSLAYTLIEDDMLTLFRGVLRIPEGLQVEAPDVPFAHRLAAGKALDGEMKARLPLPFNQPYEWHDEEEIRITQRVRLRIGYVAVEDLNPQPAVRTVDGNDVYAVSYRQVVDVQRFLETPEHEAVVATLVKP